VKTIKKKTLRGEVSKIFPNICARVRERGEREREIERKKC